MDIDYSGLELNYEEKSYVEKLYSTIEDYLDRYPGLTIKCKVDDDYVEDLGDWCLTVWISFYYNGESLDETWEFHVYDIQDDWYFIDPKVQTVGPSDRKYFNEELSYMAKKHHILRAW